MRRSLYRVLVPDAPLHPRTEVDEDRTPVFRARAQAVRQVVPGLQSPRLVSSYDGSIDQVLFCFPGWAATEPGLVAGYTSVIASLRVGTSFVVAHNASIGQDVERWFADAGHPLENVQLVPLPDHVALTDWAEDAYVSLADTADDVRYLMEPWSFGRAGDAMIADAVEEHTDIRAGVGAATISFVLLSAALCSLPVGTAYAVWVGIGAFGVAMAGIVVAMRDRPGRGRFKGLSVYEKSRYSG